MKNLGLPFFDDISKTWIYNPSLKNLFPHLRFRAFYPTDKVPNFVLETTGENFNMIITDVFGNDLKTISSSDISHKIITDKDGKKKIMYEGGTINCLVLEECQGYRVKINNMISEVFWSSDSPDLVKIEFSNANSLGGVPYELDFKQYFYTEHKLAPPERRTNRNQDIDEKGDVQISYVRVTDTYVFEFNDVPPYFRDFLSSAEIVDKVIITANGETYEVPPKQGNLEATKFPGYDFFSLRLELPTTRIEETACEESQFEVFSTKTAVQKECEPPFTVIFDCSDLPEIIVIATVFY